MKILLTGATGFIGQRLGLELVRRGHSVVATSRTPDEAKLLLPFPAKIFSGIEQALNENVDVIVHLAGEPVAGTRWSEERKKQILQSRGGSTRKIFEALKKSSGKKPTAFISASAIGFYGDRGDELLDESSTPGEDFLAQVCREWENSAQESDTFGLRKVFVRIGIVLGRHGGALSQLLPLYQKGLGGPLSAGRQWMSWIHIEDMVALLIQAIEDRNVEGPVNAVAPEPVRNEDFSHALAHALGRSDWMRAPKFALKTLLGEMSQVLLASQRVSSQRMQMLGFKFKFPKLAEALQDICGPLQGSQKEFFAEQWVPRTVEEIFPFFSAAKNLETLTPPWLGFNVLKTSTTQMEAGTLIDYRLKIHGLPVGWRTLIESWEINRQFVDTQLKGPYKKWHHTHEFIPLAGGTLLRDRVLFELPVGQLGSLFMGKKVQSDVSEIFGFRRRKIRELFG